ncbi:hypothetical protein PLICRDRAFT_195043 [Plicaturopsis crispa FD-325 SS-3]|nr:hypothetical protein PLICRDRAFT_195043 [Plicaturopsis crispa FD-325 SS-3]
MPSFRLIVALLVPVFLKTFVCAVLPNGRAHGNMSPAPAVPKIGSSINGPVVSRNGTTLPPYSTIYYFDQLIDHNDPGRGTFQQRYWHTWEFYEQGGPIILMTPGEINADGYDGYLTNATINGQIAQQQSGATIVLEHRFYGLSNPIDDLTVSSLRLHTLAQAVSDLEYFAKNVDLPMPGGSNVTPDKAPWVLIGGSYSGALTAWTMTSTTDVFYAGYASSAVVEAINDFWAYFEPIRENMAQNCSSDVQAVIAHFDTVLSSNNQTAINALQDQYGLAGVTHLDDVAGALRNPLWDWQSLQPTSNGGAFLDFCDALEVKDGENAPAAGWGADHAIAAWGSYFKNIYVKQVCGNSSPEDCFGTYDTNSSYWTDTSVDNDNRSWFWIVCNEVGFLQESPPAGKPALVSRIVQPIYDERQCQQMFPAAFSSPPVPNVEATNAVYHGWDVKVDRLFVANGKSDPWRDATLSADNQTIPSTSLQTIAVGDGFHCSDLSTESGAIDKTILAVQTEALAKMKEWLATWSKPGAAKTPAAITLNTKALPFGIQQSGSPSVSKGKPVNAWFRFGDS